MAKRKKLVDAGIEARASRAAGKSYGSIAVELGLDVELVRSIVTGRPARAARPVLERHDPKPRGGVQRPERRQQIIAALLRDTGSEKDDARDNMALVSLLGAGRKRFREAVRGVVKADARYGGDRHERAMRRQFKGILTRRSALTLARVGVQRRAGVG